MSPDQTVTYVLDRSVTLPFVRWYGLDCGREPRMLGGSLPRKLSPFQFFDGLIGLGTKPPPQFGQTFSKTLSTHVAQNVHS